MPGQRWKPQSHYEKPEQGCAGRGEEQQRVNRVVPLMPREGGVGNTAKEHQPVLGPENSIMADDVPEQHKCTDTRTVLTQVFLRQIKVGWTGGGGGK